MNARVLLLNYAENYKAKFGLIYPISWAKHGAILKRLIKSYGVETVEAFLRLHLADTSQFVVGCGHSLESLSSQLSRYIAALKREQDKPKEALSDIKDLFS
jgi:hypothetical protein